MAQKTNVLLVDDDVTVRQSLKLALVSEQFGVVVAANGMDALREFGENHIDVVLLDLNLGEESGWDTLVKLKEIRPMVPVILMSGPPENRARHSNGSKEVFMEKPLDLAALFAKLQDMAEAAAGHPPINGWAKGNLGESLSA